MSFLLGKKSLASVSVALSYSVLISGALLSWAATVSPLDRIDFKTTPQGLRIQFHTGSIVPYKTLHQSDDKLVLEVADVSAQGRVRTDFSRAGNIQDIVLRPVGSDRLRVIIHGNRLGVPEVRFQENNTQASSHPEPREFSRPFQQKQSVHEPVQQIQQEPHTIAAVSDPDIKTVEGDALLAMGPTTTTHEKAVHKKASTPASPTRLEPSVPETPIEESEVDLTELWNESEDFSEETTSFLDTDDTIGMDTMENATTQNTPLLDGNVLQNWSLTLGGLLFLIIGLGTFVIYKRKRLSLPGENNLGEESISANGNKPVGGQEPTSFRTLMDAYQAESPSLLSQVKRAKRSAGNPIGLGTLGSLDARDIFEEKHPPQRGRKATLPWAASPPPTTFHPKPEVALPPVPPAPSQALSQYAKQSKPITGTKSPKKNTQQQTALRRELKHSAQVKETMSAENLAQSLKDMASVQLPGQSATSPLQKSSKKTTPVPPAHTIGNPQRKSRPVQQPNRSSNQENKGLPANPEVLDFLRNVADLMDRDGQSAAVKRIHRGINRKTIHESS